MIRQDASVDLNLFPEDKIGEGRYREVYRVGKTAVKLIKPFIRKNYGVFSVDLPTNAYTKIKFGVEDFNLVEYENYRNLIQSVPRELRRNFADIYWTGVLNGRSASVSDLVCDCDGNLSKNLGSFGRVEDDFFWERMEMLEKELLRNPVTLLDIRAENIMVKNDGRNLVPVFVDYKRCGAQSYTFQPWLISKEQQKKKIARRFRRLRKARI